MLQRLSTKLNGEVRQTTDRRFSRVLTDFVPRGARKYISNVIPGLGSVVFFIPCPMFCGSPHVAPCFHLPPLVLSMGSGPIKIHRTRRGRAFSIAAGDDRTPPDTDPNSQHPINSPFPTPTIISSYPTVVPYRFSCAWDGQPRPRLLTDFALCHLNGHRSLKRSVSDSAELPPSEAWT